MTINYYSLNIITNDLSENILSATIGVDIGTNTVIKFFNNINMNLNILNTDPVNSNNADWLFINKRFSQNGTIINNIPLLNISGAQKFKLYTVGNVNLIDFFNGTQWLTTTNTYSFIIYFITTTELVRPNMRIDQFCDLKKRLGLTRMSGCVPALPLSKKKEIIANGYNANGNNANGNNANGNNANGNNANGNNGNNANTSVGSCPNLRNKMQYAEYVRIYGGTQKSTSATKKICLIAGPSFTY
jgi:hypothetical protein